MWRDAIERHVIDGGYDVVFLDNMSCLAPGLDENQKKEWDPISQWMTSLRSKRIAVVAIFHLGKEESRGVRGHSCIQDAVNYIIQLKDVSNHKPGEPAHFELIFKKSRGLRADAKVPFVIQYHNDDNGRITWETVQGKQAAARTLKKSDKALICLANGKTPLEIEGRGICTRAHATKVRKDAIENGRLMADGGLTDSGRRQYGEFDFLDIWGLEE